MRPALPLSRRLTALAALLLVSGAVAPIAPARAAAAAADLTPDQQARVQQATDYLQGLHSVTARFTQTDPNGASSSGVLYLRRPGKARFEYAPPSGLLVISDGHFVGVSDTRLKTFSEYPLDRTPLILLLGREISLERGVTVTKVEETPNGFAITARDGRGHTQGQLTLLFRSDPIALHGWNVVDAQGRRTEVRFGPLSPAENADPGLFYIRDPRH